jgi:isorenieratene synthase
MTDRRRVTHPAPPGLADASALARRPHTVVVGAGIAGLAAATGLAERGVAVEVIERRPYLGGRVGGWTETLQDGTPVAMNRGFHAFFRQYYNLRNLLRRIDYGLGMLTPVADYPLVDAQGRRDTFRGLPKTPPFNALAFALRSPTFRLRDLTRLNPRAAAPLAAVSVPDVYRRLDHLDAQKFLQEINFPDTARHLAFEVFSRSFFAEPAELSAGELAAMFHIYFLGSSEGIIFDVANANFDAALWNPLRSYLESRGVRFHIGVSVTAVEPGPRFVVRCESGADIQADGVALCTDVAGLQHIVGNSAGLGNDDWRRHIAALRTASPFVVQRLWLDRPVHTERPAFLGTGGRPPLDNVSVLERYERQAAQWATRTGGSVVELHAYAVTRPPDGVDRQLRGRLRELYPETAAARVVGERVLCANDCPRFAPGDFGGRPGVVTPHPGLALAGDGIRIDLPVALMERAATTGWAAANRLLMHFGLAGHTLQTVPVAGRWAALRWLAKRALANRAESRQ